MNDKYEQVRRKALDENQAQLQQQLERERVRGDLMPCYVF